MACTWINSSHDNLSIDNDKFLGFESPINLLSSVLNSPPESVSSHISNEDRDECETKGVFQNNTDDMLMESEKSFDFVDALAQPMQHSQDFVYTGPTGFHNEIEQISNLQTYSDSIEPTNNFLKIESNDINDNMDVENDTPICGNDLMLSRQTGIKFSQEMIATDVMNNNNNNNDFINNNNSDEKMDVNRIQMPKAQAKLLTKRNQCLPQLQLTVTVCPVETESGPATTTIEMNKSTSNINIKPAVISTPQLTKEILEMELEHDFDLVAYIDADNVSKPRIVKYMLSQGWFKRINILR